MSWQRFYERCIAEERARWTKGPSPDDRAWRHGPFKVSTIFGRDGRTAYKTDLQIGAFAIHVFWRPDGDPDPHDHQHDFITFPLVGYVEKVLRDKTRYLLDYNIVKPWRFYYRRAEYAHLIQSRRDQREMWTGAAFGGADVPEYTRRRPIITCVWRFKKRRAWGFWERDIYVDPVGLNRWSWSWVPWKQYIDRARTT